MSGVLNGMRVVNTRAVHQADALNALLRLRDALPIPYPCIEITPPLERAPLDAALDRLCDGGFDWLAFTSANAVTALARACAERAITLADLPPVRIAAVGDTTAHAIQSELGRAPSVVSAGQHGRGLADAMPVRAGESVLLPSSEIARDELPAALAARGVEVARVTAYRTVLGRGGADLPALLVRNEIDAIAFTSPSTVDGFVRRHLLEVGRVPDLAGIAVVCIGETTLVAAREHGFNHAIAAEPSSLKGLVSALAAQRFVAKGERSWPSK